MLEVNRHNTRKKYVFTVCGPKEEIDKLNFSLKFLKAKSQYEILVITDLKRNEEKINHNLIVDADVPLIYTNREASRILKTGLHNYIKIESNTVYCYLDNDVIVLSEKFDNIFECFHNDKTISFSKDISRFYQSCNHTFYQNKEGEKLKLEILIRSLEEKEFFKYSFIQKFKALIFQFLFRISERLKFIHLLRLVKACSSERSRVKESILLSKGIYYSFESNSWKLLSGEPIIDYNSKLAASVINKKYSCEIPDGWEIRNSGVFLFNETSIPFLKAWNKSIIECIHTIDCLPFDQTILAIMLYKFGLLNDETIPKSFNYLFTPKAENAYFSKFKFQYNGKRTVSPFAIHIYRSWGRINLPIWKDLLEYKFQELDT